MRREWARQKRGGKLNLLAMSLPMVSCSEGEEERRMSRTVPEESHFGIRV